MHLIIDSFIEIVAFICFHNHWEMIPKPIISSRYQAKKKLIQIIMGKRSRLVDWSSKVWSVSIRFSNLIKVLIFAIAHIQQLVYLFNDHQ